MPKAAVNKDDSAIFRENEIRPAREVPPVQAET